MKPRPRRSRCLQLLALAAIATLAGLSRPSTAAESSFDRTISGDRVAIHNLVGTLRVVKGDGPAVTAEITFQGRDADRLHLEQGTLRNIPTLRVIYPSKKIHI